MIRLIVPVLLVTLGMWYDRVNGRSRHEIGTHAIKFEEERAKAFLAQSVSGFGGERIVVVDSGLEEGRGVAFANDHIYFADAWDVIFGCRLNRTEPVCDKDSGDATGARRNTGLKRLPVSVEVCPEGECAAVEHGGLAVHGGTLYVSDFHRRRVIEYDIDRTGSENPPRAFGERLLGNVHDIALVDPDRLVVAESAPFTRTMSPGDTTAARSEQRGSVYMLNRRGATDEVVTGDVTHPVGVAYSSINGGRVYVADIAGGRETWRYFDRTPSGWKEKGVIWTEPLRDPADWPRLQSIVVAQDGNREAIFAAATDGLYLLEPEEGLLAKYLIGGPVEGLSWADETRLVMTTGRRLAILKVAARKPPDTLVNGESVPGRSIDNRDTSSTPNRVDQGRASHRGRRQPSEGADQEARRVN